MTRLDRVLNRALLALGGWLSGRDVVRRALPLDDAPAAPCVQYSPRDSDRRTTAAQLQVGDTVFVWAHDTPDLGVPCDHEMWRYGTVTEVGVVDGVLRTQRVTLDNRPPLFTMPYAVAYVVDVTGSRPGWPPRLDDEDHAAAPDASSSQEISVADIRPGMDITVLATAEARFLTEHDKGPAIIRPIHAGRLVSGRVIATARAGELVRLQLSPDGRDTTVPGYVYANASHRATQHLGLDELYDQAQEV